MRRRRPLPSAAPLAPSQVHEAAPPTPRRSRASHTLRRLALHAGIVVVAAGCGDGGDDADGGDGPTDATDSAPATDTSDTSDSAHTGETDDTDAVGFRWDPRLEVVSSGPILCVEPARRDTRRFDTVAAQRQALPPDGPFRLLGGGLAVADLDGDGRKDVFLPGIDEVQLYNQLADGTFREVGEPAFRGADLRNAVGATVVDADADGDLDLYVVRWERPNLLLLNDGAGRFSLGNDRFLDPLPELRSQSASFGDMDGDGDLDLFVGNYGPKPPDAHLPLDEFPEGDPSELWENQGDGTFRDVSDRLPPEIQLAHVFASGWHDLDLDGRLDLVSIHDFGWNRPSQVMWNTPSGLVRDDGTSGFGKPFAGMGVGVGDVNDDGYPDFMQSSWRDVSLLVSFKRRLGLDWSEAAPAYGIHVDWEGDAKQIFGWGTELADLDNDGDLDGVMLFGHWDEYGPQKRQVDAVFTNTGAGWFEEEAAVWGLDEPGIGRGLLAVDLDDNGWIDVLKRQLDDRTPMHKARCGAEGWTKLRLHAPAPNTHAIGARIVVEDAGGLIVRTIEAGSRSMYAGGPPEAHLGLGDRDVIERLEIHWPSGPVTLLEDVPAREILDVTWNGDP